MTEPVKTKPKHPMTDPEACKDLKQPYEECFYKWYGDQFLKGLSTKSSCNELFEEYQVCLKDKLAAFNLEHVRNK